jgi:hypothetical protein
METTAHETNEINPVSTLSSGIISSRNDKRERKHTAQMLPPGITHNMMKKYVVYYREIVYLKNGKTHPREYFKVESHPRLNKPWVSSKSVKISLLEKLNDANKVVTDLENVNGNIVEQVEPSEHDNAQYNIAESTVDNEDITAHVEIINKLLPKYTTLRIVKISPSSITLSLVYDRKDNSNGFRWTSSTTFLMHDIDIPTIHPNVFNELNNLRKKLIDKYGIDLL